jgi:cation:H+ antiporter
MSIGFAITVFASRRAVVEARSLVAGTRIPPFIIGITLVSIGTDLPEIANSIVASISGHGDINVGDSIGSAATQSTLVLGLLPILGGAFVVGARRVAPIGIATVGALLLGAWLMADGMLSRSDAVILILAWIAGSAVAMRQLPEGSQPTIRVEAQDKLRRALMMMLALGFVGGGAATAVWAVTQLAAVLGAPEYLIAFFIASIGTSLPELAVDLTALRTGLRDLAVGDVLGSTMIDTTLSVGAGPLIAPVAVTANQVVPGSLLAAAVIGLVVVLLALRRTLDWKSGSVLIGLYLCFYVALLAL